MECVWSSKQSVEHTESVSQHFGNESNLVTNKKNQVKSQNTTQNR